MARRKTEQEKYEAFKVSIHAKLNKLAVSKGKESKFRVEKALHIKDDQQFNLEGGRYLVEIIEDRLLDNAGYEYWFDSLTLEQLCEIVDTHK